MGVRVKAGCRPSALVLGVVGLILRLPLLVEMPVCYSSDNRLCALLRKSPANNFHLRLINKDLQLRVLGNVVVEALCHKPEGRGFDAR
jgi:hypothetical protein